MFCFTMALRSKAVSKDWKKISQLCEASIRSAYHQINSDIKIIVVCHETPELEETYDDRVEIINVDFPRPNEILAAGKNDNESKYEIQMKDKWKKIAVGVARAGELNPKFMMLMDADDLVSRRLSQFASSHPNSNGWILKKGYRYSYGSPWIYVDDNYNCGTNAIVNSQLIEFPKSTAPEEIKKCVILTSGHTIIEKTLAELGTPLTPLPFLGAIQVVDYGNNASNLLARGGSGTIRQFLGRLRRTRWLSPKLRQEFSIPLMK
jgi:hypothetical protein